MANEYKKDFNKIMNNSKDMPKIKNIKYYVKDFEKYLISFDEVNV